MKRIFNANFEESMNLVTENYIKASLNDINQNGIIRKLIGSFTIVLFIYLTFIGSSLIDKNGVYYFNIKVSIIMQIILLISLVVEILYISKILGLSNARILSFYYYNFYIYFLVFLFLLQTIILMIAGAGITLGSLFSSIIFTIIYLIILIERWSWFKKRNLKSLYENTQQENKLAICMEKFVEFSKKYGGIVILGIMFIRFFFPIQNTDFFKSIGVVIFPLLPTIGVYFCVALASDNIKGYYLKKYLEDYRQLSGYSIEEWYGKKYLKKHKELIKKD